MLLLASQKPSVLYAFFLGLNRQSITKIGIIGGIFIGGTLLAGIAMSAMFTYVLGSALYHGLEITCGCFGAGATDIITYKTLIRAVIILCTCGLAYIGHIYFSTPNEQGFN
ncbi:MAG: MauE/DoxX family redox-associated membrane protein [Planctomycetota bacterium]